MVVQITRAFPSVPQVLSAFRPGATGIHRLCCWVAVGRCAAVLGTQLSTSVGEPGRKHGAHPYHDRWES